MKISIIIPVYNVEAYIGRCLESVAAQDWDGEMECIIVDDCGTDSSMEITERFVSDYNGPISFLILHHSHNRGLSAARNTAMEVATGEYLYFLDSDDKITPDCLKLLAMPLKDNHYDMVVGNWNISAGAGRNKMEKGVYDSEGAIDAYLKNKFHIPVWNKLYDRKLLEKWNVVFMEGLKNEDVLFTSQVLCVIDSMYCVDVISYEYLVRNDGIIGSLNLGNYIENFQRMFGPFVSYVERNGFFMKPGVNDLVQLMLRLCLVGHSIYLRRYIYWLDGSLDRYRMCREILRYPYKVFRHANRGAFMKNIRDFHYLLPRCIGGVLYMTNHLVLGLIREICEFPCRFYRFCRRFLNRKCHPCVQNENIK